MKSQSNSKQTHDSYADDRAISFSSGSITPSAGVDPQMASEIPVLRAKKRNFVYGFILLDEHLSKQTQQAIEALGVTLLGPHGNYVHKARFALEMALIEQVARLPYVKWVGYGAPDQKLDGDLKQMITARRSPAEEDRQSIVINLFENDVDGGFKRQLETTGASLRSIRSGIACLLCRCLPSRNRGNHSVGFCLIRRTSSQGTGKS